MVRWPAAVEAAAAARARPGLGLGLHVDVGEWVYSGGTWVPLYSVLAPHEAESTDALVDEVARQFDAFRRLVGREPTHVDSHQHRHLSEPLRTVLTAATTATGIPLRHIDTRVRCCGSFYGQTGKGEPYPEGITADALTRLLKTLPHGITELTCHPGYDADHDSPYKGERAAEVEALCEPAVRSVMASEGIRLISFADAAAVGG
jgi:predicted glycoside hydrolase/deacetylase ChbG (UPF0249 family)